MLKQLEKLGGQLTACTNHKTLKITDDSVVCQNKGGQEVLGQHYRNKAVDKLRGAAPFVRVIGDAAKVSTITNQCIGNT